MKGNKRKIREKFKKLLTRKGSRGIISPNEIWQRFGDAWKYGSPSRVFVCLFFCEFEGKEERQ